VKRLAAALLLTAAPSGARTVEADGVANIAGGDVAAARTRAIADALEQAVAQGGLRVDARSDVVGGVVASDRFSTSASGHLLGHRITSEVRERDTYRVTIEAEVVAEAPRRCPVADQAPIHLLGVRVIADVALDPAVGQPVARTIDSSLADALGQAGAPIASAQANVGGPDDARRSSVRYDTMFTPDPYPAAGRLVAPTLRLERVIRPHTDLTGVPGEQLNATLTLDVIDAGTRRPLARVGARRSYKLTSRLLDLLPLGFQPPQRLDPPKMSALLLDAARQVAALPACGPGTVGVVGGGRGSLTLGAGTADGVREGDLLRVEDGGQPRDGRRAWTVVQVTDASANRATVRAVDPGKRIETAGAVTRLP
jgi:hypothetical protein